MKYVLWVVLFVVVLGSMFVGQAGSGGRVTAAPKSAAALYSKNCASCHGRDGRAKTFKARLKRARDLTAAEWQNRVSDERIFNSIINGKGKMPGFAKKLSAPEIDSLVTYVRALKK